MNPDHAQYEIVTLRSKIKTLTAVSDRLAEVLREIRDAASDAPTPIDWERLVAALRAYDTMKETYDKEVRR